MMSLDASANFTARIPMPSPRIRFSTSSIGQVSMCSLTSRSAFHTWCLTMVSWVKNLSQPWFARHSRWH